MNALTVRLDDLTVGEIDTIEEVTDAPIDAVGQPGARKGKFLMAVALVVLRRSNPAATLADAAKVKLDLAGTPDPSAGGVAEPAPDPAAQRA
ncbi:hypothetical protein [Crossiella sp. CA198]|uniref:hypothetical protein n=1 Tax=Crossiella sp. CA198 TaxID=3455607 RepID=UPI003F8D5FCA